MEGRAAARFVFFSSTVQDQFRLFKLLILDAPCRMVLDPIAQVAGHAASSFPSFGFPRHGMALGQAQMATRNWPRRCTAHTPTRRPGLRGPISGSCGGCMIIGRPQNVRLEESGIDHEFQVMATWYGKTFPFSTKRHGRA